MGFCVQTSSFPDLFLRYFLFEKISYGSVAPPFSSSDSNLMCVTFLSILKTTVFKKQLHGL